MFRFLTIICFLFIGTFAFAQTSATAFAQVSKAFEMKQTQINVLDNAYDIGE